MKTKSVISALNKILKATKNEKGQLEYIVGNRKVVVIDQGGNAIALPIRDEQVVYSNATIKSLVSFITGLSVEKQDYLKVVKSMYGTSSNERLIEMANQYNGMGE
jgi:hypothetical protein